MLSNRIKNFLKEFDQHGAHVNFTYNNKITFQTPAGGILTILSRLGILAFFFVIVNSIVYKDKTITWSYLGKSPTQDIQQYSLDLSNFDLAFSLTFSDGLAHTYEKTNYFRYYDIRIQYVVNLYMQDANGTTTKVRSTTDLPLTNCTDTRFAGLSKEINDYGINQIGWYCPTNISYQLQGQVQSTNQTRLRMIINQCKNTTANNNYCASYTDIVALASSSRVQIATLNSYFNENEFNGVPIKRSLSVESFPVAIGLTQTIQRSLRKTSVTTKDSWISANFDNKDYMFYQDIPGNIKIATSTTDYVLFTYSCDSQENFITRKVLSLADAAASAGGFASIILLVSRIIASIYSKPLFYQSILRKLYQYEVYRAQPEIEYKHFKKNDNEQKVEQLKILLNGRRTLNLNVLKEFLKNVLCRCVASLQQQKNQRLYKQGVFQLQHALDIEKVLRTIQKVKTLEKVVLNEYQRKLLKFSTSHMLRPIKPKDEKNAYEVKARTEFYLQELVRNRKQGFNRSLIKEIIGYKKQMFHSMNSTMRNGDASIKANAEYNAFTGYGGGATSSRITKTREPASTSRANESKGDSSFTNIISQGVKTKGDHHTVFQFSEQDIITSKRELFRVTNVKKRAKSKKGVSLDVQDFGDNS